MKYKYVVLVFLLVLGAPTHAAEKVVYENDFSNNPDWISDDPSLRYWNSEEEALFIHVDNIPSTTTVPDRFLYIDIPLDPTQSFTMSWRQKIVHSTGTSGVVFGLYSDDFISINRTRTGLPLIISNSNFNLWSADNRGYSFNATMPCSSLARYCGFGVGGSGEVLEKDEWYSVTMERNVGSSTISLFMEKESDGSVVYDFSKPMNRQWQSEMQRLGISYYPNGLAATAFATDPTGSMEYLIDDVRVVQIVPDPEPELVDPLILQYAPILYFHPDENYFPMNTEAFVEASALWDQSGEDVQLYSAEDLTESVFADAVENGDTSDYYLAFSDPDTPKSFNLDVASSTYRDLVTSGKATTTVYYHRMNDSTKDGREFIVLQYWFFYAMNNWLEEVGGLLTNNHEGDWESVFIFLDAETEEPEYVAYSAHLNDSNPSFNVLQYDSVRRNWDSDEVVKENERITSFVSLGSHAMYGNNGDSGEHKILFQESDLTSLSGQKIIFETSAFNQVIENFFNFEGLWGTSIEERGFSGPQGPQFIDVTGQTRFNKPVEWAGIGSISEIITSVVTNIIDDSQNNISLVFTEALDLGTEITIDLKEELIGFGANVSDVELLPNFWDITSSLINDTFTTDITFSYDENLLELYESDESNLIVYFYNPETNIWEPRTSIVDTEANTATFTTTHFSRYALGFAVETAEPTVEELVDEVRSLLDTTDLYSRQLRSLNRNLDWIVWKIEQDTKRSDRLAKKVLRWFDRKIKWYTRRGYIDDQTKKEIQGLTKQIRGLI